MRLALFLAAPLLIAAAGDMSVAEFLPRAEKLKGKGAMAIFSRAELKALGAEVGGAIKANKAEREAAIRAGRRPDYCPPAGGVKLGADEILAEFRRVPVAERRRTTVRQVMKTMARRRWPCRA